MLSLWSHDVLTYRDVITYIVSRHRKLGIYPKYEIGKSDLLEIITDENMGLLHMHMGLWVYFSATTTMVAEIGTK
jgi:hypothetical protein